jgi:hypothetical protein
MLVSVTVAILGTGMLSVGYQTRARAIRTADDLAARVAADAGLTQALHTLFAQAQAGTLDPDALPGASDVSLPNFEGTFTYTVTAGPGGGYTLTSVGNFHGTQRTVEAVVNAASLTHRYAAFVLQNLTLDNSARVDWYNNEPGDDPLQVGTNATSSGAIKLHNASYINGDVIVGVGGDPGTVIQKNGGDYAGSAYAQSQNPEVPAVTVPADLTAGPDNGQINSTRTISTSGRYTTIDLGNAEKLTINGAVELYITGNVSLGNSAEIRINPGCSLVLYVAGNIVGNNTSKFNNLTDDASKLKLLGTNTCATVTLKNAGDLYGILYAPAAALTLDNGATVRGAITARTCELKNGAKLYYDASLRDQPDSSFGGTLELASWREY